MFHRVCVRKNLKCLKTFFESAWFIKYMNVFFVVLLMCPLIWSTLKTLNEIVINEKKNNKETSEF